MNWHIEIGSNPTWQELEKIEEDCIAIIEDIRIHKVRLLKIAGVWGWDEDGTDPLDYNPID